MIFHTLPWTLFFTIFQRRGCNCNFPLYTLIDICTQLERLQHSTRQCRPRTHFDSYNTQYEWMQHSINTYFDWQLYPTRVTATFHVNILIDICTQLERLQQSTHTLWLTAVHSMSGCNIRWTHFDWQLYPRWVTTTYTPRLTSYTTWPAATFHAHTLIDSYTHHESLQHSMYTIWLTAVHNTSVCNILYTYTLIDSLGVLPHF